MGNRRLFGLPFMLPAELRREVAEAERGGGAPFWPGWMRTRWGQWLARKRWLPFGRLWWFEVKLAQLRELDAREMAAACEALEVLQLWAETEFRELDPTLRELMLGKWCKWRTWHERKAEFLGVTPCGSSEWVAKQQRPPGVELQ